MAQRFIVSSLLLLVLITNVRTQFFDFFGFQPIVQQYQTGPTPKFTDNIRRYDQEHTTKRSISFNFDDLEQDGIRRTTQKANRRKTTTIAPLFNFNFFSTTAKPRKVTKASIRTTSTTKKIVRPSTKETSTRSEGRLESTVYDVDLNKPQNEWYEKPIISNIADDYYNIRPETTTKRNYNYQNNNNQNNNNHNNNNHKTNYDYNYQNNNNQYTTKNPFYNRPGVKPPVVNNGPPITNRPVTKVPRPATHIPVVINPRPTDAGAIVFPQDDVSPEIITGPDEDYMSQAEKRRYIELAEKMCDKYKALNTKQLQAIPLLPSPEPVQINVSSCAPTNIPLVVGGKIVTINEFPHMALLGWVKLEGGGYSWKCGGSLVSDKYVLTAGHCAYQERDNTVVTGPPRAVQLGSSYLDDPGAHVVRVSAVIRHPKYKFPKSYYDLALLKLASPVTFSEVIKPACLGVPPPVGDPIIATGWGRTEFGGDQSLELRSVSLPVWDITECWNVLGTSRRMPDGPSSDSQMCAGVREGGKDTCQGDSGGPAQIQDGCLWRVVAVTSLGRSCGAPRTPGLYAIAQRAFIAAQVFGDQKSTTNNNVNNNQQTYSTNNRQVNNYNNQRINRDNNNNQRTNIGNDRGDYNSNNNNQRTNGGNNRGDYNSNYNNQRTNGGSVTSDYNSNNNNQRINGGNDRRDYNSNNNNQRTYGGSDTSHYNSNTNNQRPSNGNDKNDYNTNNTQNTRNVNVNNYRTDDNDGYNSGFNNNRSSDTYDSYNNQNKRNNNNNYGSNNDRFSDNYSGGRVWWT